MVKYRVKKDLKDLKEGDVVIWDIVGSHLITKEQALAYGILEEVKEEETLEEVIQLAWDYPSSSHLIAQAVLAFVERKIESVYESTDVRESDYQYKYRLKKALRIE